LELVSQITGTKGTSSFVQNMWRKNLLLTLALMSETFWAT